MKINLKYGLGLIGILVLSACESAMPIFDEQECEIRFTSAMGEKTFVYDERGTEQDVVYIEIQAIGFVKDYDRSIRIYPGSRFPGLWMKLKKNVESHLSDIVYLNTFPVDISNGWG